MKKEEIKKVAIGTAVGVGIRAGLGILFAPKKGSELRKDIKNQINKTLEKIQKLDSKTFKNLTDFYLVFCLVSIIGSP